jgi:tetratricopeptide (TPR) repeat protein
VTECQKSVFTKLVPLCNQYKSRFEECPFEQLWPLCVSLMAEERDFYLVIDALDECSLDHSRQATRLLKHLSDVLDPAAGKIIIFSRPSHLLGVGTTSEVPLDEIRITEEDTRSEMAALCDSAAAGLSIPKEMQLQVASRAKSRARGSFLWVNLLQKKLERIRVVEAFQKALDAFPDDCWGVYTKAWKDGLQDLDENDTLDCRNILLLLLGSRRQFGLGELEDALGLMPDAAQFIISTLCQPLVQVIDGSVQLSHASVRDFLLNGGTADVGFSASEPDATLARRCLDFLLKNEYSQEDRIGQLLRRNVGYGGSAHDKESGFYEYAARNWNIHLTALSSPDMDLLRLAGRFLRAPQFAYWAEYSVTDVGDFQAIRSTEISLTVWSKTLPIRDRSLLDLDTYFELPYTTLNRSYKDNNDDKILQWLALMHLGFYYFDKGRIDEMADVRQDVATGLSELLGRRHPLALQGASDATYTFLFNGQLQKAQRMYAEVAKDQRKVVDEDNPSPFFTEVFQAQAEYLMMKYSTALSTLTDAMAGFIRTTGPQSNGYLIGQLWYAVAHASSGHTEQAIKMLEYVRDKRKEQYGPEDSFGIATQVFAGDLYRKLKVKEQALENIKPALEFRRGFWPISHFLTLDTALVLAITYRDFWKNDKAAEIIGELERDAKLDQEQNFIRACQVKHMRALLHFEDGSIDQSIRMLEAFLIEIGSERNNRAVYWIRLDLATMLRYRAGEGDDALASSLFDGIVTDQTDDPEDEPDPPRWLEIAEDALKLLRLDKVTQAKKILQEENLSWAQEETLWMWLGVPAADTGWMRLPQGLGSDGSPSSFGWVRNL